MTDNHNYETPQKGATEWHKSLNRNFRYIDRDIEIRDIDTAKTDYRPKTGAKFLATDTEDVYIGDGDEWLRLATRGENPSFDTVSAKTIVDSDSGNGYSVDQLAGGGGNIIELPADAVVTLNGGMPTALRPDGTEIAQNADAAIVFQAAFDALQSGGGTVRIGPGEFPVEQEFHLYSDISFVGAGMGQTIIKATSPAKLAGDPNGSTNRTELKDFTYDGQNQGGETRIFYGGSRNVAERVGVINCGGRGNTSSAGGLAFRTGGGDRYNRIINCYAENCSYVSLSTQKLGEYNEIRGCMVVNPNESGGFTHPISIESNTNSIMANNTVIGGSGLDGNGNVDLAGDPALNANAVKNCVVSNNNIRNVYKGINVANGGSSTPPKAGALINGNVIQGFVEGMRIQNTSTTLPPEEVVVSNNLVRRSFDPSNFSSINNPGTKSILFNNSGRGKVVGNSFIRAGDIVGNGVGGPVTIQNNYFEDCGVDSVDGYKLSQFSGTDAKSVVSGNHIQNGDVFMNVPTYAVGNYIYTFSGQVNLNCSVGPSYAAMNNVHSLGGDGEFGVLSVNGDESYAFANKSGVFNMGNANNSAAALNYANKAFGSGVPTNTDLKFNILSNGQFRTENGGTASVADGGTIAHSLDLTPTVVSVTSSTQGHIASVSTVESDSISINIVDDSGSPVTTTETVYWEAKAR